MALSITQTYAKIGIETSPSKLEFQSKKAQLEFKQKHAKINMKTELPKVEIDQYEAFASAGLKNFYDLTKSEVERAKQGLLEYIGKVVDDGNSLAAIENGGNPIAEIAERDSYNIHEFDIDTIPKVGPEINLIEGKVNIEPERNAEGVNNGVDGKYIPAELNINYTPAQIRIFISQYASIKFNYTSDNNFNTYI